MGVKRAAGSAKKQVSVGLKNDRQKHGLRKRQMQADIQTQIIDYREMYRETD